jgi:hypothetical protein
VPEELGKEPPLGGLRVLIRAFGPQEELAAIGAGGEASAVRIEAHSVDGGLVLGEGLQVADGGIARGVVEHVPQLRFH